MSEPYGKRSLDRTQQLNWVVLVMATGIGWWQYGQRAAVGVALGGVIGAANFWLTIRLVRDTFVAGDTAKRGSAGPVMLKFFAMFGLVGMIVLYVRPDSVAFGLGFCSILAAIVLKAIFDLATGATDGSE